MYRDHCVLVAVLHTAPCGKLGKLRIGVAELRGLWRHAFVETGFQFISNRHDIIRVRLLVEIASCPR